MQPSEREREPPAIAGLRLVRGRGEALLQPLDAAAHPTPEEQSAHKQPHKGQLQQGQDAQALAEHRRFQQVAGQSQAVLQQRLPTLGEPIGAGAVEARIVVGDAEQRQRQIPARNPRAQHRRAVAICGHLHRQGLRLSQQAQLIAVAGELALVGVGREGLHDPLTHRFGAGADLLAAVKLLKVPLDHLRPLASRGATGVGDHARGHGEHRNAKDAHLGAVEAAAIGHLAGGLGTGRAGLGQGGDGCRNGYRGATHRVRRQRGEHEQHRQKRGEEPGGGARWTGRGCHGGQGAAGLGDRGDHGVA